MYRSLCLGVLLCAHSLLAGSLTNGVSFGRAVSQFAAPLAFEPNVGQTHGNASFITQARGFQVDLFPGKVSFYLNPSDTSAPPLSMEFAGANPLPSVEGDLRLPGVANYFPASDPASWITNVPTYSRVRYRQIFRGVDAIFYGNPKKLEYDFVVSPGADPGQLELNVGGYQDIQLNSQGSLLLSSGGNELSFLKPVAYQLAADGVTRQPVDSEYRLERIPGKAALVRFVVGKYDKARPLIVDPSIGLSYSQYLDSRAGSLAVDSAGNTYVAGPLGTSAGAMYVTKYSPSGAIIYDNRFGTGYNATAYGVAVDSGNRVFIAGSIGRTATLPISQNAYSASNTASYSAFITAFSADGANVYYCSYLGGSSDNSSSWASGTAVDSTGKAYVSGNTNSGSFPVTSGAYQTSGTSWVAKFDPAQTTGNASLVYSTLLGPSGTKLYAIAVSQAGNAYVTGNAPSGYPVTAGAFKYVGYYSSSGGAYVTELNSSGSGLVYSAYLGYGTAYGIAVEGQASPSAYVTGTVAFQDFPTTPGSYQTSYAGGFLTKLNANGTSEVYSTFLGGPSSYVTTNVQPYSVALPYECASSCNAYVSGWTNSTDFPSINAIQTVTSSDSNNTAFIAEIGASGTAALFSSYFSGLKAGILSDVFDGYGKAPAIAVDNAGNISLAANVDAYQSDTPVTIATSNSPGGILARIAASTVGLTLAQPASINFGSQPVGVSTAIYGGTATAVVRNVSNFPATLTQPIQVSPAAIFSQSNTCGSVIPAAGSCTLNLDFTPASSGARSGAVTIATDAANSPISISLTGVGIDTALLEPSLNSLVFGVTSVGSSSAAKTITLTNLGDVTSAPSISVANPYFFQLNNCPGQLLPGASCTIYVAFRPSTAGLSTSTLMIYNSVGPNSSVTLTGTAAPAGSTASISLTATSLNFGVQPVASSTPFQYVYITNNGSVPVIVNSAATSGDFSLYSSSCGLPGQLNPQEYCYFRVLFSPTTTGARTGTLLIADTASGSPHSVALSGTGVPAVGDVDLYPAAAVTFLDTPVGLTSNAQVIYFQNSGTAPITVDRVLVSGDFKVNNGCSGAVVPGGAVDGQYTSYYNCAVSVTFAPTAAGNRTGTLTFVDDAPGSPHTVSLSGRGQTASGTISVNPAALTFAAQAQGTTSPTQSFYFVNPGNSPVTVTGFTFTGDYSLNYSNCGVVPITLSPGYSGCYLRVQFTPTATGTRTGTVTIASSAGNKSVNLTGSGVAASMTIGLTPTTMNLGPISVATAGAYEPVYVRNTGTAAVTFTSNPAINGANASDFGLSLTSCAVNGSTLAPNASCFFYLRFVPSATGTRTAAVTLSDSAGTQSLPLSGSGVAATPTLSLGDYLLSFNSQVLGASNGQITTRFYNKGSASQVLGNVTLTGDFMLVHSNDGCSGVTVAANSYCQVVVAFAPSAAGYRTGSLTYTGSGGTALSVPTVPLAGFALNPVYAASAAPAALNFTTQQVVGTTSDRQTIYLYNNGNSALQVGTIGGTNVGLAPSSEFSVYSTNNGVDNCSGQTIAIGGSCYVLVTFTPNAAGNRSGTLTFPVTYSNNSTANINVNLTGIGLAEVDSPVVNPNSVSFVDQAVGTTSAYNTTVLLNNRGNLPFTVGTLRGTNTVVGSSGTGEFSVSTANGGRDSCSGVTVQPNSYCYLYVTFTPTAAGNRSGSISFPITFASRATAVPVVILRGEGVAAAKTLQITPGSIQFPVQQQTVASGYQTISITNTGNVNVSFATNTISVNSSEFKISYDTCTGATLAYRQGCTIRTTFTPLSTSTGLRSGTLNIADNASGGPHTVALTGAAITASQVIVLSQSTAAFGNQPAGSSSSVQYIYVTNQSDSNVGLNSIVLGGANAGDFVMTSNCPRGGSALGPRNTCYIGLAFAPAGGVTGARAATLTETDSTSGSPRTVAVSGTAIVPGPAVAFAPSSYVFGTVTVGMASAPVNIGLTNTGSANLVITKVATSNSSEFPLISDGCAGVTLTPGKQCVFSVKFVPTLGGTRSGFVAVADNASGTPQTINFAGTGYGIPRTGFSPASLTFANQNIGSASATQQVVLSNPGTDTLRIASITISGVNAADFTQTNTCPASLAPAATCVISASFRPTGAGSRGASITVSDNANNAAGSVQNVPLTGTGVAVPAAAVSPSSLTFASTNVGATSAALTATLANSGTGALSLSSIVVAGTNASDFQATNNCGSTLAAGSSCSVTVRFAPAATGTRAATIAITDNAGNVAGSIQNIALSGTGAGVSSASVNPSFLGYGDQNVGSTSPAQNVTLSNTGSGPLLIAGLAFVGTNAADFLQTNTCGTSLAAGANCTISVSFKPAATGNRQANLVITDNSGGVAGSTQSVTLFGVAH